MVVASLVLARRYSLESVEVQLPLEGGELGQIHILEQEIAEFAAHGVIDLEAPAVRLPGNDRSLSLLHLDADQHIVELPGEAAGEFLAFLSFVWEKVFWGLFVRPINVLTGCLTFRRADGLDVTAR